MEFLWLRFKGFILMLSNCFMRKIISSPVSSSTSSSDLQVTGHRSVECHVQRAQPRAAFSGKGPDCSLWMRMCGNREDMDEFPSLRELLLEIPWDIILATQSRRKLHHLSAPFVSGPSLDSMKPTDKMCPFLWPETQRLLKSELTLTLLPSFCSWALLSFPSDFPR